MAKSPYRGRDIDWSEQPVTRSKKLEGDPRILEVEYANASGSDYRYFVTLKPGFIFRGYGSRSKGFNSVADCLFTIIEGLPS